MKTSNTKQVLGKFLIKIFVHSKIAVLIIIFYLLLHLSSDPLSLVHQQKAV